MTIRDTDTYKNMDNMQALSIVQHGTASPELIQSAWQFLVDNDLISQLDDWHKKKSMQLIQFGIIQPPLNEKYNLFE